MAGTKLFVGGIPAGNANAEQVRELFAEHGCAPLEVVILPPKGSNPDARCGFVRVPDEAVTSICQSLNGLNFEGYAAPLVVRPAAKQPTVAAPLKLNAIGSLGAGPLGRSAGPAPPGVDVALEKQRAKAEGRWVDAAEWHDQEFFQAGETPDRKFHRLAADLQDAVLAEHFYEAAALYEIMSQLDAEAAAGVNASAAAALVRRGANGEGPVRQQVPGPASVPRGPAWGQTEACWEGGGRGRTEACWEGGYQAPASTASRTPQGTPAGHAEAPAATGAPMSHGMMDGQAEASLQAAGRPLVGATSGGAFVGTILSFSAERQFGFIQCPELGSDAFVSGARLGPFQVGDRVAFNVTYGARGQPHAQNLTYPDDGMMNGWAHPVKRMRKESWQLS